VLVAAGSADPTAQGTSPASLEAWNLGETIRGRNPAWLVRGWEWAHPWPVQPATEIAGFVTQVEQADPRLASFRTQWGPAAQSLLEALARGLAADGGLALRFLSPGS
jgi:hypothetical protein